MSPKILLSSKKIDIILNRLACQLIEKLGGEIVQCNFLIELEFLKGAAKLKSYELRSLLCY